MKLSDVSPSFEKRFQILQELLKRSALKVWHDKVATTVSRFAENLSSTDDMLAVLLESERLVRIYAAGLENDRNFLTAFNQANLLAWHDYTSPPAEEALQESLGDKLYNVERVKDPYAILQIGETSRSIMRHVVKRLIKDGIPFETDFQDLDFTALLINHATDDGVKALAHEYVERYAPANTRLCARTLNATIATDSRKNKIYGTEARKVGERLKSGELYYTLTILPLESDAEKDNVSYPDYVRQFFEMCDQPWDHISKAHEVLIEKLNGAREVTIENDDGTNLSMSFIDEDGRPFTFANSLINKNVPGSEVFSAPRRDSVTGTLVAKGRFVSDHDPSKVIENLRIEILNGKIDSFTADKGAEYFQEYLDRDPNNYYIGEIGFGTNPHLRRHVLNGLLVEKIGRSFHFAFGGAYTYDTYEGKPVHLNNKNKTENEDHWDITTILAGKGGRIKVNGELIMNNGKWLDPRLAVLNDGWAVIPVHERPNYWKSFQGYSADGHPVWATPNGAPQKHLTAK